jgi:predicted nucleotidyltransferase
MQSEAQEFASYIRGWKARWRERAEARRARASAARTSAERCAAALAQKHGARRVWLYGSTLFPESFHERSDIDLAAEGLDDWLRAGLTCESLAKGFEVSLVPLEDAHEGLRTWILAEGVLLYDAGS